MTLTAVAANVCPSASLPVFPPPPSALLFARPRLRPVFTLGAVQSRCEFRIKGQDYRVLRAIEKRRENSESEVEQKVVVEGDGSAAGQKSDEPSVELNKIGIEIKEALERRKEKREESLLSGVGEEIQEIEWPAFGKVLGITGVVLGVIAGSSVALLTVNAVLAEISDRIFAGKGVQDFFG